MVNPFSPIDFSQYDFHPSPDPYGEVSESSTLLDLLPPTPVSPLPSSPSPLPDTPYLAPTPSSMESTNLQILFEDTLGPYLEKAKLHPSFLTILRTLEQTDHYLKTTEKSLPSIDQTAKTSFPIFHPPSQTPSLLDTRLPFNWTSPVALPIRSSVSGGKKRKKNKQNELPSVVKATHTPSDPLSGSLPSRISQKVKKTLPIMNLSSETAFVRVTSSSLTWTLPIPQPLNLHMSEQEKSAEIEKKINDKWPYIVWGIREGESFPDIAKYCFNNELPQSTIQSLYQRLRNAIQAAMKDDQIQEFLRSRKAISIDAFPTSLHMRLKPIPSNLYLYILALTQDPPLQRGGGDRKRKFSKLYHGTLL